MRNTLEVLVIFLNCFTKNTILQSLELNLVLLLEQILLKPNLKLVLSTWACHTKKILRQMI